MNALVIGSGGYIGRNLCAYLKRRGWKVSGASSRDGTGIDPATGLFRQGFAIPPGTQAIIYLAQAPYSGSGDLDPWHIFNVNVGSAIRAAQLGRDVGVEHFVYASTGNVYRWSIDPCREDAPLRRDVWYATSKVHAEEALAHFNSTMAVKVLRLFGVYGPYQRGRLVANIIDRVLGGRDITVDRAPEEANARQDGLRISVCYIEDLCRIVEATIVYGSAGVMNVASDDVPSIRELAQIVAELTSRPANLVAIDHVRSGNLIADIARLKTSLNPSFTPLRAGLEKAIAGAAQNSCAPCAYE